MTTGSPIISDSQSVPLLDEIGADEAHVAHAVGIQLLREIVQRMTYCVVVMPIPGAGNILLVVRPDQGELQVLRVARVDEQRRDHLRPLVFIAGSERLSPHPGRADPLEIEHQPVGNPLLVQIRR